MAYKKGDHVCSFPSRFLSEKNEQQTYHEECRGRQQIDGGKSGIRWEKRGQTSTENARRLTRRTPAAFSGGGNVDKTRKRARCYDVPFHGGGGGVEDRSADVAVAGASSVDASNKKSHATLLALWITRPPSIFLVRRNAA